MHLKHTHHSTPSTGQLEGSSPTLRASTRTARAQYGLLRIFVCWAWLILALQAQASPSPLHEDTVHGSGALVLHHPDGDVDALSMNAHMDIQVQGLLANMTLVQTFSNTSNQWLSGSYLFPLPDNAAIRGLRISIGDRTIVGKIRPRQQANAEYEQAVQAGQIASLMEQQRPNLFTTRIANIAPQAQIKVRLDIMLPVNVSGQVMSLKLPTTLTPRYLNASSSNAGALQSGFISSDQSGGPSLDVSMSIAPLASYQSVSSNMTSLQSDEHGLRIDDMRMDRDLTISWPVQHDASTRMHAFVTSHDGERYVQLLVNPPEHSVSTGQQARELILVLDKSGSMAGVSMRAAIEALNFAIDGLTPDDLLNIVAFDDQHYTLFNQSLAATDSVKQSARRFAAGLQADGGTEMESALSFALQGADGEEAQDAQEKRLKQIVFITDGSIGYEDVLLQKIRSRLGDSRLFTVGIGSAPNQWFLDKAAEAGRGVSVSIENESEVSGAISELLDGLRFPVLTDIAIDYPQGQGEMYPQLVPDLYANRPAMWVGKISDEVNEIVITGRREGLPFQESISLPAAQSDIPSAIASSAPSIAMHWARQKIAALEDEQRYAGRPDMHRQSITRLAMDTGLVTKYTSLIAVEEVPVRPADAAMSNRDVANHLPHGNLMTGIALPQGAAGVDTLLWFSLLLGFTGLVLLTVSRQQD